MNVLDLFSGIGGFSLGLERAGMKTVAFCEIDKHCQKVLKKHWPDVPIFEDVTKLRGSANLASCANGPSWPAKDNVDIICGGFPCQDISVGGPGDGIGGARSGLWKEYWRLINEIKPKYAIIENVERLRKKGLGVVLRDLFEIGYNAEWHCITGRSIGLPMQRDRLFVIAYSGGVGLNKRPGEERFLQANKAWACTQIYPNGEKCELELGAFRTILSRGRLNSIRNTYANRFAAVPKLRRVVYGVPEGLDELARKERIKQLGNAVVPQIPELIGRAIMDYENDN